LQNNYTGETEFLFDGHSLNLCYDWRALGEIQTKHGATILKELFSGINPLIVADLLLIGCKKHHPDMTLDKILDMSPPLVAAIKAVDKALERAYFGADGMPKEKSHEDNPDPQDDKKKT